MPGTEAKRDYYEVLGVARTATRDDIKHDAALSASAEFRVMLWPFFLLIVFHPE